jgi:hypothetical protein
VLVDHAAPLAQVSAGSVCAPLEHQFAVVVPFRQQVGKAAPIALFVDRDACIVAAGRAAGARDRTSIATPPSPEKVACGAVYRAIGLIQYSNLPYDRPTGGKTRAHPCRPPLPRVSTLPYHCDKNSPSTTDTGSCRWTTFRVGPFGSLPGRWGPSRAGDPLHAGYRPAASPPAVAAPQSGAQTRT